MQIQKTNYSPTFSAKFVKNDAFKDVVKYAQEAGCLRTLDSALNNIAKAEGKDIRIIHGKAGTIFSTFIAGKRSVSNFAGDAKTPAEATMDGILELSMLSKKFKSLMGVSNVKDNITAEKILKEYTV